MGVNSYKNINAALPQSNSFIQVNNGENKIASKSENNIKLPNVHKNSKNPILATIDPYGVGSSMAEIFKNWVKLSKMK